MIDLFHQRLKFLISQANRTVYGMFWNAFYFFMHSTLQMLEIMDKNVFEHLDKERIQNVFSSRINASLVRTARETAVASILSVYYSSSIEWNNPACIRNKPNKGSSLNKMVHVTNMNSCYRYACLLHQII